jgi:signal transduction histidine kinase
MTTVRGYLQLFQRKEKFAEYKEQFGIMIEELDRANGIITEFLSLAKTKAIDIKPGNLNDTIRSLFPLFQAEALHLGQEVQADVNDIPTICYDEKEIRQLILNLVRNGMEAMEAGGVLKIKTYLDNEKVSLSIQDTGKGIDKRIMPNIGTPFFTTKDSGVGLGLSICYRIAERHKAKLEIRSSNAGTNVIVKFPIWKDGE